MRAIGYALVALALIAPAADAAQRVVFCAFAVPAGISTRGDDEALIKWSRKPTSSEVLAAMMAVSPQSRLGGVHATCELHADGALSNCVYGAGWPLAEPSMGPKLSSSYRVDLKTMKHPIPSRLVLNFLVSPILKLQNGKELIPPEMTEENCVFVEVSPPETNR